MAPELKCSFTKTFQDGPTIRADLDLDLDLDLNFDLYLDLAAEPDKKTPTDNLIDFDMSGYNLPKAPRDAKK